MEVILPNKNKKRIIILSILAFVFLASGIFLLWRVNQPETVAPEDSEAASAEYCQSIGCYYHAPTNSCTGIDGCVWRDGTGDQHCGGSCGSGRGACAGVERSAGGTPMCCSPCSAPPPPTPPANCVPEYPPYNAMPYETTPAPKKSELILYYRAIPPYTALAQFIIEGPNGQRHTINASSSQVRIKTGIILEKGEKARMRTVYEKPGGGVAIGWQPVNPGNTCGSGAMGPPQNGNCERYPKIDVSSYISWADSFGGETLISRQCWADAKEWEGDYDFNDFFVQLYYLPIAPPPPPPVPVCDGGNWDNLGKPSGVYPYCSEIKYSFVAKDTDGVDKSTIVVKVNGNDRVNARKTTIKTGDTEVRVDETLSTETNCLKSGDYTITASWKDKKGAGGPGTKCALTTSFTVAEEIKNPDWDITKIPAESCVDDNTENPRAKLEYVITIKNKGEGSGEITSIVDTLDSKVLEEYIEEIGSNGEFSGGKISWVLTGTDRQFAPGQSKTYTYSFIVPKDAFGTYDNTVEAIPSVGNSLIANASIITDCIIQEPEEPIPGEPIPEEPIDEPETPPDEPLPGTGIFDDTKTAMISGFLLIILGFTWRFFGRGVYLSVEFLGKVPRKISIQMKDLKSDIRAKRRIKEIKVADRRKKDFERKVVKD
jgi:hypothetical protein